MNYIKHLTGFFHRVATDHRLNPTHVSLYMAIFQFWNAGHFQNPVAISRQELMRISKICAKATYHKCIRELHNYGYLNYQPSFNPYRGSLVYLFDFQASIAQPPIHERIKIGTSVEQLLNNINDINENNMDSTTPGNDVVVKISKNKVTRITKLEQAEPLPPVEKSKPIATLEEIHAYFLAQNSTQIEAQKFYNYFQSNGWKVGGKTPMKDWQASARNWILNVPRFNPQTQHKEPTPGNLSTNIKKDYNEPL